MTEQMAKKMGEKAGEQRSQDTSLTIHLYSFGYRYSGPPQDDSDNGGGFVFDCRALPNPYWDATLRPHSGLEAPVAAFMQKHPQVSAFAEHAAWLVRHTAQVYTQWGYPRLMVAFGCTGGRHRSVYQLQLLEETLKGEGYRVRCTHLELQPGQAERL